MEELHSWQEEKRSAFLYRIIAANETAEKQHMFSELGAAAEEQAEIWRQKMIEKNIAFPSTYQPDFRCKLVAFLIKKLGAKKLRHILPTLKIRGMSIYSQNNLNHAMPLTLEDIGQRHRKSGSAGNLRAGVFGVNDGLISNVSLILGMAGAGVDHKTLFFAGIAGLLAGAFSMAAGEYVSVRSQREMLEYQIALEKMELELYPEEEAAELALIYTARGLPKDEAEKLAATIISDPAHALDVLTREELGLNPNELGSPISAGLFSFCFFSLGAFVPLLPFLFRPSSWSLPLSIILTGAALFSVGAILSLFTGRSAIWGGLRMLLIGSAAGVVTYFIGHLLGVSVS